MIVKGGIVDPTTWAVDKETKSCRQILFILKEAPVRETFDLIDHLYKGGRAATYAAVAMWSYLLRHYGLSAKSTDWEIVKSKKNKREQNLQHVAVININDFYKKKAKGKHSNDKILLEEYSEQRHRAIERKITEISPSIIVTGGKVVRKCLAQFSDIKCIAVRPYASVYEYTIGDVQYILLSMPHPNAMIKRSLIYQDLISIISALPQTLTLQPNNTDE